MALILRIFGILALLMGLLWMGQGAGIIMWPASSFMLAQREWIVWGGLLALVGAGLLLLAQRRR
jgi:LPXTG-motif cell wall-anchored protein